MDEESRDLQAALRSQNLPLNDSSAVQLRRQIRSEYQAAQASLLGGDGAQQLSAYEKTSPVRDLVDDMNGTAVLADYPLDPTQAAQLTTLVNAAAQVKGNTAMIDWKNVAAQASTFLTPEQIEAIGSRLAPGPDGLSLQITTQLGRMIEQADKADAAAEAQIPAGN